ncbi:MAG: SPOR domain-containing protein [Crocinitomicaceae bacterium]
MTIEQFIIDLLKQHDCVVVPNFGGFIANYQPAIINQVNHTIKPPSKQVLFNANLIKNDGLLANYIADKTAISYPESLIKIEDKAKEWKTALSNDKRLVFGEIGFLYEQDGIIVFEQNRETNLWLKAYGLSSIQFIPAKNTEDPKTQRIDTVDPIATQPEKIVEVPKENKIEPSIITLSKSEEIEVDQSGKEEQKIIPIDEPKKSRSKWGYLAAACAIPFLFYTYWIPMETNFLETGNIQLADFNPFNSRKVMPVYEKRSVQLNPENETALATFNQAIDNLSSEVKVYHYQFDESIYMPVKLDKTKVKSKDAIQDVMEINASGSEAPIQLITGCFSIESNAKGLVSELNSIGYSAYVLDKNKGLYRVAVKGFQNMKTAKAAKADLKSKSYSSWILKK